MGFLVVFPNLFGVGRPRSLIFVSHLVCLSEDGEYAEQNHGHMPRWAQPGGEGAGVDGEFVAGAVEAAAPMPPTHGDHWMTIVVCPGPAGSRTR